MNSALVIAICGVVAGLAGVAAVLLAGRALTRRPPSAETTDRDGNEHLARVEAELDEDGPISGERGEWP